MSRYSRTEKKIFEALQNIQFEKDKDAELARYRQEEKDNFYYKIMFGVFLFLLLIAGGFSYKYFFFKKVSGVPQKSVAMKYEQLDYLPTVKHNQTYIPTKQKTQRVQPKYSSKNYIKTESKQKEKIYYWTDDDGDFHATNTGYPANIKSLNHFNEKDSYNKKTKIRIKGNSIYIPVTFYNDGRKVTTEMLLDTGCSTTLVTRKIAGNLRLKNVKKSKYIVADGRRVYGYEGKTGYMKVGPHTESNIKIHYYVKEENKVTGLLGMNFLKNHPFMIDTRNKMIIWE